MKQTRKTALLASLILLIALLVRIWGLTYDLPYIYNPDEPRWIVLSQNMFKTGDLNPHFFNYPSLFFYINTAAYVPYYLIGKLVGAFSSPADILPPVTLVLGVTYAPTPTAALLGRILTVIFSVGTAWLVFLAGRQLTGKALVGLLAALLVAVSPTSVANSRPITSDTYVAFFAAATLLASIFVYQQGQIRHYILAGLCVGLTASSKYNGALVVLAPLLAHFLRYGRSALKEPKLYLGLVMCGVGFLAGTPFALLDFRKFVSDIRIERWEYSTGHTGMEGNTLAWYLGYMWQTGGILYILAALEMLRGIYTRSKEIILLSFFPVLYFVFISTFVVRNDQTFLPLTPFMCLLAASFLTYLLSKAVGVKPARGASSDALRRAAILAVAGLLIVSVAWPAVRTAQDTLKLTTTNSRETARVWINENLPSGAKVGIEAYAPFIDTSRFSVEGIKELRSHPPEWYVAQGFDYLVFGQGLYGRFYAEPERYSAQVSEYNNLFGRFELVKLFPDEEFEVRVYKIR